MEYWQRYSRWYWKSQSRFGTAFASNLLGFGLPFYVLNVLFGDHPPLQGLVRCIGTTILTTLMFSAATYAIKRLYERRQNGSE
jgi:hypothetical protein